MVKEAVPGFTTEGASEEGLPAGAPAMVDPGKDPVLGITEDLGDNDPTCDKGEGAGANVESLFTVLGGAMRGGNC